MTLLDVSIVNVALPTIKTGIHAGDNDLQWIVSGYALALGLLLVPSGRLGDARGRRTVFMTGVALFALASAACGAAPSATFLVLARVVQGFAGGLITPQISGFIQTLFQGEERGKAFGYFGTMIGVSTAIGPLLGGVLIAVFGNHSGWRAVFFVNLPVGVIALILARRYLPPPKPRPADGARTELDPIGVVLLGLAVICILVPFIEQRTWHSPLRPLLFVVAAGLARPLGAARAALRAHPRAGGQPRPVQDPLVRARRRGRAAVLRRVHRHVLHPQPVPADRPALLGAAVGSHLDAVRGRRRADGLTRQPPGPAPRAQAGGVRAGDGDLRAGAGVAGGTRRARAQRWVLHRAAAADRRDGRRVRDLSQPDAVAVAGAQRASGQRRRRAPDRAADRLGGRDRDHRQRVLLGAGQHSRRFRRSPFATG